MADQNTQAGQANTGTQQTGQTGTGQAGAGTQAGAGGADTGKDTGKDTLITIKVDGVERGVTLQELKTLAEKSAGADQRFQEAANARKEATRGLKIQGLLDSISNSDSPDQKEIDELAGLLGIDATEFSAAIKGDEEQTKKNTTTTGDKGGSTAPELIGADKLAPEIRAILEQSQKDQLERIATYVENSCGEAVDKDEILSKIVDSYDDDTAKSSVKTELKKMVFEDVQRKILAKEPFGAEMIANSVQRARAFLTKFGIPARTSQQAPVLLGLGPSGTLPAEVQANEPIKRVASSDTGWENNVVNRVLQQMVKSIRGK